MNIKKISSESISPNNSNPKDIVDQFVATLEATTKKETKNSSLENLRIIVVSLKTGLNDDSILIYDSLKNLSLSRDGLKQALDELLSNKTEKRNSTILAYVVLDEAGSLFSDDLIQEKISCVKCLKTIQKINTKNRMLEKPVIIVTDKDDKLKIVILKPNDNSQEVGLFFLTHSLVVVTLNYIMKKKAY